MIIQVSALPGEGKGDQLPQTKALSPSSGKETGFERTFFITFVTTLS